eukprot:5385228-Amphidinium_carterae.2
MAYSFGGIGVMYAQMASIRRMQGRSTLFSHLPYGGCGPNAFDRVGVNSSVRELSAQACEYLVHHQTLQLVDVPLGLPHPGAGAYGEDVAAEAPQPPPPPEQGVFLCTRCDQRLVAPRVGPQFVGEE